MVRLASGLPCAILVVLALSAPASASEEIVHAPGPSGHLEGMFRPATGGATGGGPIAVIVPGSGPTDRDGNNPLGIRAATYRLLAEALSVRGIASVRIDKRGLFGSRAAIADPEAVSIADYAADVRAWAGLASQKAGRTCAWVIGHSEGGLVALAATRQPANICGVILLAAPGRPLADVMREQLRANPANAPILEQAMAAIDALAAGRRVATDAMPAPLAALFRPSVQGFMIDVFAHDPAKLAAAMTVPLLVVQGGRDLQVATDDAQALARANPSARLVLLPEANHVFKDVAADNREENLAAYARPDAPLSVGLVDAIAGFIKEMDGADRATNKTPR